MTGPRGDDELNYFWNEIQAHGNPDRGSVDRETAELVARMHRLAAVPIPEGARQRVWDRLAAQPELTRIEGIGPRTASPPVPWKQPILMMNTSYALPNPAAKRRFGWSRGRRFFEGPIAWISFALLLLVIAQGGWLFVESGRHRSRTAPDQLLPAVLTRESATPSARDSVTTLYGDSARTGVMPGPGPVEPVGILWSTKIAEGRGLVFGSAVVSNGLLFAGAVNGDGESGTLVALDSATGVERWRVASVSPTSGSPTVVDGVVYFRDDLGFLYAVDASSGNERWRIPLEIPASAWASSPAVVDGVVYINVSGTGSSPSLSGGTAYVVNSAGGKVSAFDANTGLEKWRFTSPKAGVYALDAKTGSQRWAMEMMEIGPFWTTGIDEVTNSVAVAGDVAYVVDGKAKTLYALDAATGQEQWKFELGAQALQNTPAIANGTVYVTDELGYVYAVDAANGAERWHFGAPSTLRSSAVIAGDTVYVCDESGVVVAIDASTGTERWQTRTTPSAFRHRAGLAPIVVNGMIFVGNFDGSIYAFGQVFVTPEPGTPAA